MAALKVSLLEGGTRTSTVPILRSVHRSRLYSYAYLNESISGVGVSVGVGVESAPRSFLTHASKFCVCGDEQTNSTTEDSPPRLPGAAPAGLRKRSRDAGPVRCRSGHRFQPCSRQSAVLWGARVRRDAVADPAKIAVDLGKQAKPQHRRVPGWLLSTNDA